MGIKISDQEIRKLMDDEKWGTLIAIEDGKPYAVETSFAVDDNYLYTGTKFGGRMNTCLEKNPAAAFKICEGDNRGHNYRAALVESTAEILHKKEDIVYCLNIIYEKLGMSTDNLDQKADNYVAGKASLSLYRLPITKQSGIRSGR